VSAAADILRRAKARIEDPDHWTTGAPARGADGEGMGGRDSSAVRWCALGALDVELGVFGGYRFRDRARDRARAWAWLRQVAQPGTISSINDTRGHAAVMAMYDEAIRLAEAEA